MIGLRMRRNKLAQAEERKEKPMKTMTAQEVLKYLNVQPIFGGSVEVEPEPAVESSEKEAQETVETDSSIETKTVDGDPDKMTDLLKQVADLNGKLSSLSKENEQYKTKEQQAQRAQQSREETLEQDLTEAQQTIQKMDEIIRYTAVMNAIQSNPNLEFYSAKHVMRELDPNGFDLEVDLENGTATVNGIDNELKRIARECEWLVKSNGKAAANGNPPTTTKPRSSGAPPTPPGGNSSKTNRRRELSKRVPVIMHNRSGD